MKMKRVAVLDVLNILLFNHMKKIKTSLHALIPHNNLKRFTTKFKYLYKVVISARIIYIG